MTCLVVRESGRAVRVGRAFLSLHAVLQRKSFTKCWPHCSKACIQEAYK